MVAWRYDFCGLLCLCSTYGSIIYADYAVVEWMVIPTMSSSLWGAFNVVCFNVIVFLTLMAHTRAVFSDPGTVPLPETNLDFSDVLRSSKSTEDKVVSNNMKNLLGVCGQDGGRWRRGTNFGQFYIAPKGVKCYNEAKLGETETNPCGMMMITFYATSVWFEATRGSANLECAQFGYKHYHHHHPTGGDWTICSRCETYRPPRAHHCRICQRCVRRMDHHCPWINNCVGEQNQKYFIQFLMYVVLQVISIIFALVVLSMYDGWYQLLINQMLS